MSSSLLTLLAIILSLAIPMLVAIIAWIRNKSVGYARTFVVVTITGMLWATSNYYSYTTANLQLTTSATRLTMVAGLWLLISLCYFAIRFPSDNQPSNVVRWAIVPAAVLGGIFSASSLVISAVAITNNAVVITPGPLYFVYIVLLLALSALAVYLLYRQYVHASLIARNQIRYVAFGIGASAFGGIILNAILPIFYPTVGGPKVNFVLTICFTLFVGYGLIRNRFIDIHTIGAKLITYFSSLVLLIMVISLSKVALDSQVSDSSAIVNSIIIVAAALTLIIEPVKHWLEIRINKLVRRHWYEPENLFRNGAEIIAAEQRLEPLLQAVLELLCSELGVTGGAIILIENGHPRVAQRYGNAGDFTMGYGELMEMQSHNHIMLADDLPSGSLQRNAMENHRLRMVAQLASGGILIGFLVMSTKQSGDIFTQQDVRVLKTMSNQLAVAIVRSQSFEKISQFNSTLEKKVEEATHELRKAHDKLAADDKLKTEFIMLTSHNLRTPLAIINGYTDMIGETPLNEQQRKYFDGILTSQTKLKRLVDDLLTIATLEGGQEFVHKPVTAVDVLEPLVDQMKSQMENSELQLSVILDVGDAKLNANLLRLKAAFWNLLDNAFKFTKQGSINFEARIVEGKLQVTIKDSGIGIPSEELPTIFNKFHRASSTLQYDFDGEGIGLYLSKLIIDEHSGTIQVTSEADHGTKVVVTLPLSADPMPATS